MAIKQSGYTNEELVDLYNNETAEWKKQQYATMLYEQVKYLMHKIANDYHVCNHDFDDKMSLLGIAFHRSLKTYKEGMDCKFSSLLAMACKRLLIQHHQLQQNGLSKIRWDETMIECFDEISANNGERYLMERVDEYEDVLFESHYEHTLKHYTEKERHIIKSIESGKTIVEIGNELGVSKQNISQITQRIFPRLYTELTGKTYDRSVNFKNTRKRDYGRAI